MPIEHFIQIMLLFMKQYVAKRTTFVVIVKQILFIHVYCTSQNVIECEKIAVLDT
jgi:hypothetical protein